MKAFMDKDFLLKTGTARKIYHEAAAGEPIFDYHCHLNPREIAEDSRFPNLASMWLGENRYGDHYKWRMMRANGVDEKLVTGDAEPWDKFLAWARTMPALIGNPLYHWTHLELRRYFDINEVLNGESARAIWDAANEKLRQDPEFSALGIFKKFKVYAVGTTDDPADSLEWHEKIRREGKTSAKVLPSFRPDRALNIEKPDFAPYIAALGKAAGRNIAALGDLLGVLKDRVSFFDSLGCRAADHGLEYLPFRTSAGDEGVWEREMESLFAGALAGKVPAAEQAESWKTFILTRLAAEYYDRGWAMQIHLSAVRSVNSRALGLLGPDTGFDAIHDHPVSAKLARLLDYLQSAGKLPKTIFYSLNPKDFYPLATIMGSFQGDLSPGDVFSGDTSPAARHAAPGAMQLGSAWWFLDHRDGMENQMRLLANVGLLSRFVGMLTDSRSFLSYPRHEYFRRILCNMLGDWAEEGEIPGDFELLGGMARDISFRNAQRYFEIP
ncbi:MAG: glucuronate isomerase [Treponema sp.]|jgi:glucuronate isomerase|nr:glucuronate isomerase [Treponema sp.]